MNGKFGANDFYNHPPRWRFSLWLLVPAVAMASLAFAALWAETNHAATWRANNIAAEQVGKLGP